ncbi:MAG: TIGR00730 family Rossman fold protein [Bacteroidales bacterium]|nr:TIGR00730 family Rossman fold protein [Bacteroidales bacterium]
MTALFFCSANEAIDPRYNDAARQAVRAAAAMGYHISSGGTVKGTMRVVSEEGLACGAFTKGVIPRFMAGVAYPGLSETVWTDTMSDRKEKMLSDADAVIALPGGIGTMDELFEALVLVKLGKLKATVIAFNVDGFYDSLAALMDHFVATGMLLPEDRATLKLPRTIEELKALL